jgi:two-component system cell cycle sensor histidine kinase/response regulator CckA
MRDKHSEEKKQPLGIDSTNHDAGQQSPWFLNAIAEQISEGVIVTDLQGDIVYVNQAACGIFGYEQTELLGQKADRFNAEPHAKEIQAEIFQTLSENGTWRGDHLNRRKDGSTFYCDMTISVLRGPDEHPLNYMALVRDITARVHAEMSLEKSEAHLREVFDNISSGVAVYEPVDDGADFILTNINRAGLALNNSTREEVIGKRIRDFFPLVDELGLFEFFQRVHHTGVPENHPSLIYRDNQLILSVENYICKLPGGEIMAIFEDSTPRAKAEAALASSEERLKLGLESVNEAVWEWRPQKEELYASQGYYTMLGYAPDEIPPSRETWKNLVHPDDLPGVLLQNEQNLLKGKDYEVEYRMRAKDGNWRWILSRGKTVDRDPDGNPVRMLGTHMDISKRKQAELEVMKFRAMADMALHGNALTNLEGNLEYINPYFAKMHGYTPEELEGKNLAALYNADQIDHVLELNRSLAKTGSFGPMEVRHTRRDKTEFPMLMSGVLLRDDKGEPRYIAIAALDITESKKTEEALAKSEERYRSLVQLNPDGVYLVQDGIIKYANPESVRIWGAKSSDELVGRRIFDLLHEGDREKAKGRYEKMIREGGTVPLMEFRFMLPDGNFKFVEATASLVQLQTGPAVQTAVRDISQRKETERALAESEARFRALMEQAPMGLATYGTDGHLIMINKAMMEMWQIPDAAGVEAVKQIDLRKSERIAELGFTDLVLRAFGGEATSTPSYKSDMTKTRKMLGIKSGPQIDRWLQANYYPIKDSKGKVTGVVYLINDVTERKKAEEERAKMEARLAQSQKMDALGTLSSGIAHDFNNILAAIMGFSELAQLKLGSEHPARRDVEKITSAADRARHLVKQILTFSRKAEVSKKPLCMNAVVQDALSILQRTIPKMIRVEVDQDPDLEPVTADPQQLEQIVLNLVSNAADAIGGNGTITISTRNQEVFMERCALCSEPFSGKHSLLSVKDDGSGIPPKIKAKIFDPFFTTKDVGKGTGLGLSTVYGIVNSLGGHIQCESQTGVGTEFIIYLPWARQKPAEQPEPDAQDIESYTGQGTILVVDDDANIRVIASEILATSGYNILNASSGEEAIKIYQDNLNDIDLVLLDLGMPGMGGKACLPQIIKLNPQAKVLIASGYVQYESSQELENLGAAGMVAKPYRGVELLNRVKQLLSE